MCVPLCILKSGPVGNKKPNNDEIAHLLDSADLMEGIYFHNVILHYRMTSVLVKCTVIHNFLLQSDLPCGTADNLPDHPRPSPFHVQIPLQCGFRKPALLQEVAHPFRGIPRI